MSSIFRNLFSSHKTKPSLPETKIVQFGSLTFSLREDNSDFSCFPTEILLNIFHMFELKDLLKLRPVCKNWAIFVKDAQIKNHIPHHLFLKNVLQPEFYHYGSQPRLVENVGETLIILFENGDLCDFNLKTKEFQKKFGGYTENFEWMKASGGCIALYRNTTLTILTPQRKKIYPCKGSLKKEHMSFWKNKVVIFRPNKLIEIDGKVKKYPFTPYRHLPETYSLDVHEDYLLVQTHQFKIFNLNDIASITTMRESSKKKQWVLAWNIDMIFFTNYEMKISKTEHTRFEKSDWIKEESVICLHYDSLNKVFYRLYEEENLSAMGGGSCTLILSCKELNGGTFKNYMFPKNGYSIKEIKKIRRFGDYFIFQGLSGNCLRGMLSNTTLPAHALFKINRSTLSLMTDLSPIVGEDAILEGDFFYTVEKDGKIRVTDLIGDVFSKLSPNLESREKF